MQCGIGHLVEITERDAGMDGVVPLSPLSTFYDTVYSTVHASRAVIVVESRLIRLLVSLLID
jgi:hypothetical protein